MEGNPELRRDTTFAEPKPETRYKLNFGKYAFLSPLGSLGEGGMGGVNRVQIIDPDKFAQVYAKDHVLAGSMPASVIRIYGTYDLDDDEFKKEVEKRIDGAETDRSLQYRLRSELEKREKKLVEGGWIAAAKTPGELVNEEIAQRFFRESRVLYKMGDHPNITKYIAFLGDALIMEYFPSKNLDDVIGKEGKLAPDRALRAYLSVLSALRNAHGLGIIHRDVKPANILTDGNAGPGEVFKLTDFGLAKPRKATADMPNLTMVDEGSSQIPIVGTPSFLAPEQASKKAGEVGPWTDMYQLGFVMYELLTGKRIYNAEEFGAKAEKILETNKGIKKGDAINAAMIADIGNLSLPHPHYLRDVAPDLSEELERLVAASCQKAVNARFADDDAEDYARTILDNKVFYHDRPNDRPTKADTRKTRVSITFNYADATLAERDRRNAQSYEACDEGLARAEAETDITEKADILPKIVDMVRGLPEARYKDVHARYDKLADELEKRRDEIEIFKPHKDIYAKIKEGFNSLKAGTNSDSFYEISVADIEDKSKRLHTRANQARDRMEKLPAMGVAREIVDKYVSSLDAMLGELEKLGDSHAAKKKQFVREKMEELEAVYKTNPNEAGMLIIAIKKAVNEPGEENIEIAKKLGDYSTAIQPSGMPASSSP